MGAAGATAAGVTVTGSVGRENGPCAAIGPTAPPKSANDKLEAASFFMIGASCAMPARTPARARARRPSAKRIPLAEVLRPLPRSHRLPSLSGLKDESAYAASGG